MIYVVATKKDGTIERIPYRSEAMAERCRKFLVNGGKMLKVEIER